MDRVISEVKPLSARVGRTKSAATASSWRVVGEDGLSKTCHRADEPATPQTAAAAPKGTAGKRPPVSATPTPDANPAQAATESRAAAAVSPATTPTSAPAAPSAPASPKPALAKRKPVDLDSFLGRAPTRRPPRPKAPEPPDPLARLMSGEGLSDAKVDTQLTRLIDAWQTLPQSAREAIVELMETSIHGRSSARASDSNRSGRPNSSAGWRRFFNVLAGS
jgi:hypothetical protein